MDIYAERIKPLFDQSGKSDAELEREIGIPARKISQWNINYTRSYTKYIPQIAAYFHVSTDYLLGNTDVTTPPVESERAKENAHDPKTVGEDSKVSTAINFVRCASPDEINEIENFFAYLESKRKTNETKS